MPLRNDLDRILIDEESIKAKVSELAQTLSKDYADKKPILLCILKGSIPFFADVIKQMNIPLEIDCIAVSSYGSGTVSGELKFKKDTDADLTGRHVIVVEDIIDSGNTLYYLKKYLQTRNPASVKICTLLDKPSRRVADVAVDYKCFDIEDYFVVGYGLDFNEMYRNLPYVAVLSPKVYE